MWPLATVVMWSLCLSVGPTKTAELINMPIGLWTRVGPRNYIYSVMAHISPGEGAIWVFWPIEKHCNSEICIFVCI